MRHRTTSLINLTINLFIGLSVGTNVVVSRDLGAGRHDNVSRDPLHISMLWFLFTVTDSPLKHTILQPDYLTTGEAGGPLPK